MLDKVPPEVLTLIAYHSSLATLLPPQSLLLTSRSIHNTISPSANPRLYARIYRSAFDTAAVHRRIGDVNAPQLAQELRRRVEALARLARMVKSGDLSGVSDEDVWVIYLLLVENGASSYPLAS